MNTDKFHIAVIAVAIAIISGPAFGFDPEDPPVWRYAKECFAKVGVTRLRELHGPFNCQSDQAVRLPVTVHGKIGDIGVCQGDHCLTDFPDAGIGTSNAPAEEHQSCDKPAWLAADHNCYGNSYLQFIKPPSSPDVTAALLCRHNKNWNNSRRFDDIAMIVHNNKNGETCWFQSRLDLDGELNGRRVKGPASVRSHKFWQRPLDTMQIGCIACHDSGPFVVSPWIRHAFKSSKLFDKSRGPYKSNTRPFNKWSKPTFIDIGKYGLKPNSGDKSCTSCHKIAAGGVADSNGDGIASVDGNGNPYAGDRNWMTCDSWIDWATEHTKKIPGANDTYKDRAVFMPPVNFSNKAGKYQFGEEWNQRYKEHVDQLKSCCVQLGEDPSNKDANCKIFIPRS